MQAKGLKWPVNGPLLLIGSFTDIGLNEALGSPAAKDV